MKERGKKMEQTQNTEKNWVEFLKELKAKVKNLDDAIVDAKNELNTKRGELNAVENGASDYKTFKKLQALKEEKEFISNMLVDLKAKRDAILLEALPEFNRLAISHLNDDVKAIEKDTKQKAEQNYKEYLDKQTKLFDAEDEKVKQLKQANAETKELLDDLFPSHFLQNNGFNMLNLETLQYGAISNTHLILRHELLIDSLF